MRLIALVFAVLVANGPVVSRPAAAQGSQAGSQAAPQGSQAAAQGSQAAAQGSQAAAQGSQAAPQSWTEYRYPDYAFTISFPAEPKIETTTYEAANGRAVQARVYAVTRDAGMFKMTIAELSDAGLEEGAVIDHAIKTLAKGGEIKLDIPHRISRVYGRQLSILGSDGSRSSVALFYHDGRLYQIEGKSLPTGNATADAIRFQQSLVFTDSD
jgi:hypothetical protein